MPSNSCAITPRRLEIEDKIRASHGLDFAMGDDDGPMEMVDD
jgi:hypothetical protein